MRRPITSAEEAQISFIAFTSAPKRQRSAKSAKKKADDKGTRALAKAREEVLAMFAQKNFSSAEVRHVVALHAVLHEKVIGVDEEDLNGVTFLGACSAAKKLLVDSFESDLVRLIEFVRWCWSREKGREARRVAENNTTGSRLSWRGVFIFRSTLTDYRAAIHRAGRTS